jgi:hypothetical protein
MIDSPTPMRTPEVMKSPPTLVVAKLLVKTPSAINETS